MTNKLKTILDDAKELNALGLMPENDVAEINKLLKARELKTRIAAVKMMSGEEIKAVRARFGMSQSILALGMSKESVSKWERNEIKPSGPALRILNTLAAKGPEVFTK